MGTLSFAAKRIALASGLYRPARWLVTRARPKQLRAFREEVAFYRSLLPENALCFDIGANIGDRSEALLASGVGRVVAFEPNPIVAPEIRARCGHDSRWTMIEVAIGRCATSRPFYLAGPTSSMERAWAGESVPEIKVPVLSLESAVAMWGVPDYCKIDVEGWELEVLSSLAQPIPILSFEFHLDPENVRRTKACLAQILQLTPGARVNVTPAESARFHFTEWRLLEAFAEWFPGDLKDSLPRWRPFYGDIFVRSR
jgi:FkbM family methyltransferase